MGLRQCTNFSGILYIQLREVAKQPYENWRQFVLSDIAASALMDEVKQHATRIVDEHVPVPSLLLLAFEVYPVFKAWRQPGADSLSLVIWAIHDS